MVAGIGTMAILAFSALVMVAVVQAGTTGKISGVVTNQETGKPIAGAVVQIVGMSLSARTDAEGRYVILNVPVGRHTLVASVLGEQPAPAETEASAVPADRSAGPEGLG